MVCDNQLATIGGEQPALVENITSVIAVQLICKDKTLFLVDFTFCIYIYLFFLSCKLLVPERLRSVWGKIKIKKTSDLWENNRQIHSKQARNYKKKNSFVWNRETGERIKFYQILLILKP